MNGINVTYSFVDDKWHFDDSLLAFQQNILTISFVSTSDYSNFDGVQFGYKLEENGSKILSIDLPPEGIRYQQVSKAPLVTESLLIGYNKLYKLTVYITRYNTITESTLEFTGPAPVQPFPSWTWQDNTWVSPVPKPQGPWEWDEKLQQWVRLEAIFPYLD